MIESLPRYFQFKTFLNMSQIIEFNIEVYSDKNVFPFKIRGSEAAKEHKNE
jgi:hypothetical protein